MTDLKIIQILEMVSGNTIYKNNVDDIRGETNNYKLDKNGNIYFLRFSNFNLDRDLKYIERLKFLTELNLSDIGLTYIKPLGTLKNLKKLWLERNDISSIEGLEKLINLESLSLNRNKISDIKILKSLKNLTSLDISHNLIEDISDLIILKKLNTIDLSFNKNIQTDCLKYFENLIHIELRDSNICSLSFLSKNSKIKSLMLLKNNIKDISPLSNLVNLESINLGKNLISDISTISQLPNLKNLWLIENPIKNLKPLSNLKNLTDLSLGRSNLSDISSLKNLINLRRLHLQDNKIEDLSPLKKMVQLKDLKLDGNLITDLSPLKNLTNLSTLDLNDNPLSELPEWIVDFQMEIKWYKYNMAPNYITLFDNPIKNPPVEIIQQGKQAIKRYFKKIREEGIDYIYEVKVTLVGEGSAGKTSLQKRLLKEKSILPKTNTRTRGIDIKDWNFSDNSSRIAHIWDFGGQDVYYPVHRFFITENSVFILLASTRQTHHNFDYWIPTIYQFGGESPIIIGQTCHDGNKISWNDLGAFLSNTDFNIIKTQNMPYYELNLPNNNEGLEKIRKVIVEQILNLPHYGRGVPKSWANLRRILNIKAKTKACITFDEFKDLCTNSNPQSFNNPDDIKDCARFFHDIGVILWYNNQEELNNWIILQPEWAMNAVYKIIDDEEIQNRRGNIYKKDFERLWHEELYEDKHGILKKMLEIFKIAFPKKHKREDYIIPARLLSMPDESRWKNYERTINLEYVYDFMPRGMVNQLSAELSRYIISNKEVWNNAVNFTYDKNASSQVIEDFYNRKIIIKAKGEDARGIIILIKDALKNITDGYKGVTATIRVPCTCGECKQISIPTYFEYEKLLEWYNLKKRRNVACNESGTNISIEKLLFNTGLSKELENTYFNTHPVKSKKIFISYSKFDEDYLQDFSDHLITLREEGLTSFNCREIGLGDEWDETIKKEIDECDIMVCLISVKFLNTNYIRKIEIPKAVEQNKIIVPIIIKPCDWETSELGKFQAAQRGRIVSLDNDLKLKGKFKGVSEEEKAAFWTAIVKEMREKLF